ncbi:MAG: peptide chain release factor N(5)-glutamine methyltransferase [Bacteroidota bacterium]|nr:peptide chain release factor N(5)-glutamine methyltransferase [Bacteroidota bacterium]MDP3145146.1 peptide chain release factor N(5)-glutamine methyltransferase [Bacteroidota bacterium]
MRIASNSLSSLVSFYHSELNSIYDSAEIQAILDLTLEHYLGYSKTDIITRKNENLNQSDLLKLYFCCKKLKNHTPIQYILNEAWFYNLKFFVNEHVLIPRPETEELVDLILKENKTSLSFLDIGTGSGCIPVAIKINLKNSVVYACDVSPEALTVAKKNAVLHNTDTHFIELDILNEKESQAKITSSVDVIISNPPYIKFDEKNLLNKHVIDNEPHLALFVNGADDILFYKKIIDLCGEKLNNGGKLYFELNPLSAEDVLIYAQKSNLFKSTELIKDMSGKMRFLRATKN